MDSASSTCNLEDLGQKTLKKKKGTNGTSTSAKVEPPRIVMNECELDMLRDSSDNESDNGSRDSIEIEDRRTICRKTCGSWWGYKIQITGFIVSALLFGLGAYYFVIESTHDNDLAYGISMPLFLAGATVASALVAIGIEIGLRFLFNRLLAWFKGYYMSVLIYYLNGVKTAFIFLLWSIIVLIFVTFQVPRSNRTGLIRKAWVEPYFYLTRTFTLVFLVSFAFLFAKSLRLYIAQDFNARAHTEKLVMTLNNEANLTRMLGIPIKPWFVTIYKQAMNSNKIDPLLWQQCVVYVNRHTVAGQALFRPHTHGSVSQRRVKAWAKTLFHQLIVATETELDDTQESVRIGKKKHKKKAKMTRERFMELVSDDNHTFSVDAQAFWEQLDPRKTGAISSKEFIAEILGMFEERVHLSVAFQDSNRVLHNLDTFIMLPMLVIIIVIALTLFNQNLKDTWVAYSGIVFSFSFIFSSSVSSAFACVLFLFSNHPYDVGDVILIQDKRYQVLRIHLRFSELIREDGLLTKFEHTSLMSSNPLFNVTTSGTWKHSQVVNIPLERATPEFIDTIQTETQKYLDEKPVRFTGNFTFFAGETLPSGEIKFNLVVEFSYPRVDLHQTRLWESELILFFADLLRRSKQQPKTEGVENQQDTNE